MTATIGKFAQVLDKNAPSIGEGTTAESQATGQQQVSHQRNPYRGLSAKLLALTALFVMLSEILIFVPSIANFRNSWLADKAAVAGVAATLLTEARGLSPVRQQQLLDVTKAEAISLIRGDNRWLIAIGNPPAPIRQTIQLEELEPLKSIVSSMKILTGAQTGSLRIQAAVNMDPNTQVDLIIPIKAVRADMLKFSANIFWLSLAISIITATLVYFSLRALFLRPMLRLTQSMAEFARQPENTSKIIRPSARKDEIGCAEQELERLQRSLNQTLQQQRRMAALGLAVSKINHDLRNLLASAQLFTERLETLPDPTVQRLAPKVLSTLDRATNYTKAVMDYGKAQEAIPQPRIVCVAAVLRDVAELLELEHGGSVQFKNNLPNGLEVNADPEQLFRVLLNLCRNAVQAMQSSGGEEVVKRLSVWAQEDETETALFIADTGPGIPAATLRTLFQAFHSFGKQGGTGLGLAIAREIALAHGGTLDLVKTDSTGTTFCLRLPRQPQSKSGQ
ncbi:sensor histidine kinase [Polycladidibacter hongkongensis]|uniref:sensor histidine kinase n=1 Tax=Polycladidibacter hongkongensis TaxID=1647556 RepID=UPI0009EA30E4|nr:HAMP domain-containing sensor histidine kinase [Pseudovibrio hongkongensis]